MPTHEQRARLRADLDAPALTDEQIDDWYARAEADHAGAGANAAETGARAAAVEAAARLYALRGLLAAAARRADYAQGQTSERLGQVFGHLERLNAHYAAALDVALKQIDGARAAARWGRLRKG